MFEAEDLVEGAGMLARVVEAARHRLVDCLDQQGGLAAARHARHAGEGAERNFRRHILQVVLLRAGDLDPLAVALAPFVGHRHLQEAGEILPRKAFGVAHDVFGLAFGHHAAAVNAGAGSHVNDMVSRADRILVMLDHDHRIAEIAQPLQRFEQAVIVALVKTDGGFVQHIENAGETRTDLRGKPDALAFAARQRAGVARQRQVVQADIVEEVQPLADFLQDAPGNLVLLGGEVLVEIAEPGIRLADRHLRNLADMESGDLHGERFGLQAVAAAILTIGDALIALDLLACPGAVRFAPAPFEVRDHAFERLLRLVGAHAVVIGEGHDLFAGAVKDDVLRFLRQLRPGRGHRELVLFRQRLKRLRVVGRGRARPGRNRALLQRQAGVRHDEVRVHVELRAEAVAGGACAERIVEREEPGLYLVDGEARNGAGEARGKDDALRVLAILRIGHLDHGDAIGEVERDLETVRQPVAQIVAHDDTVDHNVDIVFQLLVERGHVGDLVEGAVHLHALEALLLQFREFLAVLALAAANDRRHQIEPRAFRQCHHAVDHLRHGLALDGKSRRGRVGHADARPEEAHVVVDFGDGADRRARVAGGRLLFDRDRWREAVDLIDIRLLHHFEELPRIGRQALHIAPLPLGIDRVEGKRRLAGARQPGNHDQLVARQFHAHVAQIVLARAGDADEAVLCVGSLLLRGGAHRPELLRARSAVSAARVIGYRRLRLGLRLHVCRAADAASRVRKRLDERIIRYGNILPQFLCCENIIRTNGYFERRGQMGLSFDTLGYSERLQSAGSSKQLADEHARLARDMIISDLVTREDLRIALAHQTLQFGAMMVVGLGLLFGAISFIV